MIKILIGGSPCTFWSIAQKNGRETEAEGMGWELFKNYLIAKEKFQPDLFLYENNKSAARPIKEQISRELGVDLMYINSALVSAQNRQRFYAFNWQAEQPADRGLVLRDILEGETTEKTYTLAAPVGVGYRNRREEDGKLYRRFEPHGEEKSNALTTVATDAMCAIPICVNSKGGRGGVDGIQPSLSDRIYSIDGKATALTASYNTKIAEPVRIGTIENNLKNKAHDSKQYRVYSPDGKSTTLCGQGGGVGAKAGLYAVPANADMENVYEVKDGKITINGRTFPIKLSDGFYIIRKPTVKECCRLQTLPDDYCRVVSDSQARKGLGNGWTAEIIIHILSYALKDVPRDEEIVVLSMYDGIGTGRYCFEKMGFTNVTYYAYEIDQPAMKVSLSNFPDIIQLGDAFDVRRDDWELGKCYENEEESKPEEELTDLSDAPEEIKEEIMNNAEQLERREGTEAKPATVNDFNVAAQLKRLADERKALANILNNDRFADDVRALEYAISVLEVVGL